MQTNSRSLTISLATYETLSWPVKIRVRAKAATPAPRKPLILPVSSYSKNQKTLILRVLEIPSRRPRRSAVALDMRFLNDELNPANS